jgi:hypothetical protein
MPIARAKTASLFLFDDSLPKAANGQCGILPFPLPDMVRVISLWEPYASLVVDGKKTIETRTWPWPYESSWLVIQAAKHLDKSVCNRLGLPFFGYLSGQLAGLVWVEAPSRLLLPEDEAAACFYAADRYAWPLKHARRFVHHEPFRGPQKFSSVDRSVVLRSLGIAA